MRLFRRHRGSQTVDPAEADPDTLMRAVLAYHRPADRALTARQVLTAVLADVPDLDGQHDYVMSLVDDILLGLDANGLTIVASGEVE